MNTPKDVPSDKRAQLVHRVGLDLGTMLPRGGFRTKRGRGGGDLCGDTFVEIAKGIKVANRRSAEIPEGAAVDCATRQVVPEVGVHPMDRVPGMSPDPQGVGLKWIVVWWARLARQVAQVRG